MDYFMRIYVCKNTQFFHSIAQIARNLWFLTVTIQLNSIICRFVDGRFCLFCFVVSIVFRYICGKFV